MGLPKCTCGDTVRGFRPDEIPEVPDDLKPKDWFIPRVGGEPRCLDCYLELMADVITKRCRGSLIPNSLIKARHGADGRSTMRNRLKDRLPPADPPPSPGQAD